MAKNNIIKFLNATTTNKELADKVATLATEYGYDFTDEELLKLGYAVPISDEETETIEGGRVTFKGPRFH